MAAQDRSPSSFSQTGGEGRDNEREMAVNRMAITTILFGATLFFGREDGDFGAGLTSAVFVAYMASAFAFFVHVRIWPQPRVWRRVAAMAVDTAALTFVSYIVGPILVGLLYPGYLLVIYGYGFRYGVRWLVGSAALSIVGVLFVLREAPLWRDHDLLAGGLVVGLVIIPAYAVKLVQNLWQAKAKAEESNRAKSMFVAAVSHDLRTPLNAIIGLGDILAASKLPREEADMARLIGAAGRSLLGQIDSILDFSRLEMGRDLSQRETVDLPDMLYRLRELLDVSAQAKGVRLLLRAQAPLPRFIEASPRHLKDSLVNLVGNAIKFTHAGYVEIAVAVAARKGDSVRLRFEVRDSGIGMGAEEQARIFERFTQANEGIRETYGGSGLGLAIAKQLVLSLGGEIGVVSARGAGSTFWFEFDAPVVAAASAPAAPAASVWFVGDDGRLRDMASSAGFDARAVENVEELAETGGPIVLDLGGAQRRDWAAVARRVRRRGLVIVVDDEELRLEGRLTECSAVLRRPCDADALADAIRFVSGPPTEPERALRLARPVRDISILVAEDNKTNQKVIAKMLSLSGGRPTLVEDGRAALEALANGAFDLVLMDINMPKVDGVEAARRLRARERASGRRTPIIALTADVTAETRAKCMAAGIDDCITKPIDWPTLERAIARVLPERVAAQERVDAEGEEEAGVDAAQADEGAPTEVDSDLNLAALADLEKLGGPDFVREVATQFVADAAVILSEIAAAVRVRDVAKFRDEAHALRSCSANVGARSIYRLCLSWREIAPEEFMADGAAHLARLEREFERARRQLAPYLSDAA